MTRNFTEIRTSECRRISHGMTRNFTEKTEAETRNEEQAEEFATDEHGISRKRQKQRHGKEEHIIQSLK